MKKSIFIIAIIFGTVFLPTQTLHATPWIIIQEAIKKAIRAIDLQIQRQQNKVIWLQNAQKTLENTLSKLKLDEISDWTKKQKEQYEKYYEELSKVKSVIAYYQRIRNITKKQSGLVSEYSRCWNLIQRDKHFTADEIAYMGKVYSGILEESVKNLDQIGFILKSFTTTMTDAQRLELIHKAADEVDANYNDLVRFNRQNMLLSLQRAKTTHELQTIKKIYGLP